MDLGIRDRVAIVTGAEGGMDFAAARILPTEGVKIVLTDKLIDKLDEEAKTLPGEVATVKAGVTKQAGSIGSRRPRSSGSTS